MYFFTNFTKKIISFFLPLEYSAIYFISFMLVTSYTLLNMFVLILIQHFEEYHKGFYKILTLFQENKEKFRFAWLLFTQNPKKKTIHLNRLIGFLKFLGSPIGSCLHFFFFLLLNNNKLFTNLLFKALIKTKRSIGQQRN